MRNPRINIIAVHCCFSHVLQTRMVAYTGTASGIPGIAHRHHDVYLVYGQTHGSAGWDPYPLRIYPGTAVVNALFPDLLERSQAGRQCTKSEFVNSFKSHPVFMWVFYLLYLHLPKIDEIYSYSTAVAAPVERLRVLVPRTFFLSYHIIPFHRATVYRAIHRIPAGYR